VCAKEEAAIAFRALSAVKSLVRPGTANFISLAVANMPTIDLSP